MTTEIELQLRLDQEGRTAFDASASLQPTSTDPIGKKRKTHHDTTNNDSMTTSESIPHEVKDHGDNDDGSNVPTIDYSSKTVCTGLSDDSQFPSFGLGNDETKVKFLDELSFDCEVSQLKL